MEFSDPMVMAAAAGVGVLLLVGLFMMLSGPSKAKFLNKKRQKIVLGERVNLSHDTVRFRFTLPKATPEATAYVARSLSTCGKATMRCEETAGSYATVGKWTAAIVGTRGAMGGTCSPVS